MHTFKKKKSDGQKDDMRFLTLVTGNFHGILHHVVTASKNSNFRCSKITQDRPTDGWTDGRT